MNAAQPNVNSPLFIDYGYANPSFLFPPSVGTAEAIITLAQITNMQAASAVTTDVIEPMGIYDCPQELQYPDPECVFQSDATLPSAISTICRQTLSLNQLPPKRPIKKQKSPSISILAPVKHLPEKPISSRLSSVFVTDYRELPDGTKERVLSNGTKERVFLNGTKVFPEEQVFPKERELPDGTKEREFPDGTKERGNFVNKELSGKGKRITPLGCIWEGIFEKGILQKGTKTIPNYATYIGSFKNDLLEGEGEVFHQDKTLTHEKGVFQNNFLNGTGQITFYHNKEKTLTTIKKGTFKHGWLEGNGIIFFHDQIVHGVFVQDRLHGPGTICSKNQTIKGIFVHNVLTQRKVVTEESSNLSGSYCVRKAAVIIPTSPPKRQKRTLLESSLQRLEEERYTG